MRLRSKRLYERSTPQSQSEKDTEEQQDFFIQTTSYSRKLQQSFKPETILCRQSEKQYINNFIKSCLLNNISNRVLYISGMPGVGKTNTTLQVVQQLVNECNKLESHYINAMNLKQPGKIFQSLYKNLNPFDKLPRRELLLQKIEQSLKKKKKLSIVILDEVDFLMTRSQEIYYNLFEWAVSQQNKIAFIIIANTLDFPERLHGKIISRMGDYRLTFKPYTSTQIAVIVRDRIQETNIFTDRAIDFACKKLCSFTSDIRKILSVLRRAQQQRGKKKVDIQNIAKLWRQVTEKNQVWKEKLQQFHLNLLNAIKENGGKANIEQIWKLTLKQGYKRRQIENGIVQLAQMEIVKYELKNYKGFFIMHAQIIRL